MLRENRREKLLEEMKKHQEFQQQTNNIKFIELAIKNNKSII